jgi:hypothetical protein
MAMVLNRPALNHPRSHGMQCEDTAHTDEDKRNTRDTREYLELPIGVMGRMRIDCNPRRAEQFLFLPLQSVTGRTLFTANVICSPRAGTSQPNIRTVSALLPRKMICAGR